MNQFHILDITLNLSDFKCTDIFNFKSNHRNHRMSQKLCLSIALMQKLRPDDIDIQYIIIKS